ncbi:superoxide dismutase family protein [Oceanobacillus massiliensis]|uniref:superoxide dismutase family protein n=1 Tax=Oceanobacillus massiliensis TaxID=1465765 RepID=UPI000288DD50|nr:superoxide dismutase family protein [Oceanobacillus massiliensis]
MRFLIFILISLLAACQPDSPTSQKVEMYNASGDMVGTATLNEQNDGVGIELKLEGLTPGFHGIHVHEFPKCEGPDFTSAGNHFNPEGKEHGLMHPDGPHLGDLPNIEADAGGLANAELMLAGATLLDGKNSLLNEEGVSLVVHEGQDDGVTQPSGESGVRILCGEIKKDNDSGTSEESPTDPTEFNEEQEEE